MTIAVFSLNLPLIVISKVHLRLLYMDFDYKLLGIVVYSLLVCRNANSWLNNSYNIRIIMNLFAHWLHLSCRHSAGYVYLRFDTVEAAVTAQRTMHMRWFARRLISAIFLVMCLFSSCRLPLSCFIHEILLFIQFHTSKGTTLEGYFSWSCRLW